MSNPTKYGRNIEASSSSGIRTELTRVIGDYMKDEYGAESSRLCLNQWQIRINMEIDSAEELRYIMDEIHELVDSSKFDETDFIEGIVSWDVLVTDTKGQYNGFSELGDRGEKFHDGYLIEENFPLKAFRISVY